MYVYALLLKKLRFLVFTLKTSKESATLGKPYGTSRQDFSLINQ